MTNLRDASIGQLGEEAADRGLTIDEIEAELRGMPASDVRVVQAMMYGFIHKLVDADELPSSAELRGQALVDAMEEALESRGVLAAYDKYAAAK
jgi:hypothetical protein